MLERQMLSDNDVLNFMELVREARGVSRSELETAIGVSQGMISRWKNSQSFCKRKELYKIFEYLEIEFILRSNAVEEDAELQEDVQEEVLRKPTKEEYLNGEILRVLNNFLSSASLVEKSLLLNYITTAVLLTKQD